jgi:hypothetical protein
VAECSDQADSGVDRSASEGGLRLGGRTGLHPFATGRACGAAYMHRVRTMGICDRPTAARSPWQNAHPGRDIAQLVDEDGEHASGQLRQRRPFGDKQPKQPVDVAHPLAHDHAELSEVRSDGADQAAALSDQKVAGSVEQENGLLVGALDRHKPHAWWAAAPLR